MSELPPTGIQEQREKPKIELWMIDDSDAYSDSYRELLASVDPTITFRTFDTARAAIEELERRKGELVPFPHGIMVDGDLLKDQNPLFYGPVVIEKIIAVAGDTILLITNSANEQHNKNMIVYAGGNAKVIRHSKIQGSLEEDIKSVLASVTEFIQK